MKDLEKYELSQYKLLSVIKKSDSVMVELVENTLENKKYVKKTYYDDKRTIFYALKDICSPYLAKVEKIYFGSETIVIEEYVEGNPLSDIQGSHFDSKKVIGDLISAVETLHAHGVIHRDIKPSNIIVKPDGGAVLIDYSIARLYDSTKITDTEHFGTIGYAPPEQYGYSQSDFKSDIYSLGKTIVKISEVTKIPKSYKNVAEKCCEFDPSKRFPTVGDIRRSLKLRKVIWISAIFAAAILTIVIWGVMNSHSKMNNEVTESEISEITETHEEPESAESLILSAIGLEDEIRCFPVEQKEKTIDISLNGQIIPLSFAQVGNVLEMSVDGEKFELSSNLDDFGKSYDDTGALFEIVIYDWNRDGIEEILPVMCDGRYVEEFGYILQNGSVAWCLYLDGNDMYTLADGVAKSVLDPLTIYADTKDTVWGDMPTGFKFVDGCIIEF